MVALPVPHPYARRYVSGMAVEKSHPEAVGALVDWIVNRELESHGAQRRRAIRVPQNTSACCSGGW